MIEYYNSDRILKLMIELYSNQIELLNNQQFNDHLKNYLQEDSPPPDKQTDNSPADPYKDFL